jgi:hypothetical protein
LIRIPKDIAMKKIALAALFGSLLAGTANAMPPKGWHVAGSAPNDYEMGSEPGTRHAGDRQAFIRARTSSTGFGTLMQTIDARDYRGKRIRLSGFLQSKGADKAQMWMRIDGTEKRPLGFDNMEQRALRGDTDWKRYDIVLDVPVTATDIAFGFLLSGKGQALADDFKLETVGNDVPVTDMARPELPVEPVNMNFAQQD